MESNSIVDIGYHYAALTTNGMVPVMPPIIDIQPLSQTIAVGSNVTFSVSVESWLPVVYQWYFNSNLLAGATNFALTVANVQFGNAGAYSVVVSNANGVATSSNATLTVLLPPAITLSPTNLTVIQGQTATFAVSASGTPPMAYQWYFNGKPVIGATNATLNMLNVQPVSGGWYSVAVGNLVGRVLSTNALLTVLEPPSILAQPASLMVLQGSNAIFTVTTAGSLPLNYQWRLNGTNIFSGITDRVLALTNTITTAAGNGSWGYAGDGGPATAATLGGPSGVAVDAAGNLFIADSGNSVIRKVDRQGTITTVAGNGDWNYYGDGGPATSASLNYPVGVAVDASGNLWIADEGNNVIRKVAPGGTISTVAGNGDWNYYGDSGPATSASFAGVSAIAVDGMGNLYIADNGNSVIRKVDASGTITTVAGNGSWGYAGDGGPATAANLGGPGGVAVNAAGNLFIADSGNSVIRKVDASGTITTVAGNGDWNYYGDGGSATSASLNGAAGVAVDASGNLWIADNGNNVIRQVDASGIITTVAGNGTGGYSGDGGSATGASLSYPAGVAVDSIGNLSIADSGNSVIRAVEVAQCGSTLTLHNVTANNAGNYTVTITNLAGSVTSSIATLVVITALDSDYDGRTDAQELTDGTDPLNSDNVLPVQLAYFPFDNTNTWTGSTGQLPLVASNIAGIPSFNTNAVRMDAANPAILAYRDVEANGNANINLRCGTILFWFKPDWTSVSAGGKGLGSYGRLIEVGQNNPILVTNSWTVLQTNGWWSLCVTSDGNQLIFGSSTNGNGGINLSGPIAWTSNQWHEVVLTYSPTNSALYIDGHCIATGFGPTSYPNIFERAQGIRIGSDQNGNNQARGAFDELETFNYPLSSTAVVSSLQVGMPTDGLIAWWKGEGNALDSAGTNDGAATGVSYRAGVAGQAFHGGYVSIPDAPVFQLTNALSIVTWIKPLGDGYVVFWRGDSRAGFDPYFLSMEGHHNLLFQICRGDGANATVTVGSIPYFKWTHVVATWAAATGNMKLYTNGQLAAVCNTTNKPFAELDPSLNPLVCIGSITGGQFPANADIDETALYSRALADNEILRIYNGYHGGSAGAPPMITLDHATLTLDNTTVGTNGVVVKDADSPGNQIVLIARSPVPDVTPLVTRTSSNSSVPGQNGYAVTVAAAWGYYGTNTITLVASNTTFPYLTATAFFTVQIPNPNGPDGGQSGGFVKERLGYWRFNDAPAWRDEGGLAPVTTNGLNPASSWSGDAVALYSAQQSLLEYPLTRTNGTTNSLVMQMDSGSVRFWFQPDWGGLNAGGNGPGKNVRLFEVGHEVSCSWILALTNIVDQTNFFNEIKNATGGVAMFIQTNLTTTSINTDFSAAGFKDLIKDINLLLLGNCIYDPVVFDGVSLRTETTQLMSRQPAGEDLVRLNRMLLEDAFPEIVRAPVAPSGTTPAWLGISVNQLGTRLKLETQAGFDHLLPVSQVISCAPKQWCQIVLTCETNDTTQTLKLYFNGQLLGSAQMTADPSWWHALQNDGVLRLGSAWSYLAQAEGAFDELETFNYPLSGDEVAADYARALNLDTDGDGLSDIFEAGIGTNPQAMDTDCDGLPDGWEYTHGYNPSDPYDATPFALQQYETELLVPGNTNSSVPTLQVRPGANAAYLTWDGVGQATNYTVYRSTNLFDDFISLTTTTNRIFADLSGLNAGQSYYYQVKATIVSGLSGDGVLEGDSYFVQSEVVSVTPFGCGSNPPPLLRFINTLNLPAVNDSYPLPYGTLLTNSSLINIGGRPLVYVVDQVVSGSLMINGAPYSGNNNVISNGSMVIWTPPGIIPDPGTPAFRTYVSDGVQRFDNTVDVKIVVQPKRTLFAWGQNNMGQLGDGHYADSYTYALNGAYATQSNAVSYFPWCNGSFQLVGAESDFGDCLSGIYGGEIISNYTAWEMENGVIPFDRHWQSYTNAISSPGSHGDSFAYNPIYSESEVRPVQTLNVPNNLRSVVSAPRIFMDDADIFGIGWFSKNEQTYAVDENGKLWQWGLDYYGLSGHLFSLVQSNRYSFKVNNCGGEESHTNLVYKANPWDVAPPSGWDYVVSPMPVITLPTVYRVPDFTNGPGSTFDNVASVCGDSKVRLVTKRDGSLWSWGDSRYVGRPVDANRPGVIDLTTIAVVTNDWVFREAYDYDPRIHQLIDLTPARVNIPGNDMNGIVPGRKIVEVQHGAFTTLARCLDGSVWWFGDRAYQSPGAPYWNWDRNSYDPAGMTPFIESDEAQPWAPVCLNTLGTTNGEANPIVKMSVTRTHWVFLRANGSVSEWGDVPNPAQGDDDGERFNTNVPVTVVFPPGVTISSVAAALHYGVALDDSGMVWAWGWINYTPVLTPRPLPLKNIVKVVCSLDTVLALDKEGSVWGWGNSGTHGLLQLPPPAIAGWILSDTDGWGIIEKTVFKTRPVRISGVQNVSDIFAGSDSAFAIGTKDDGLLNVMGVGLDKAAQLTWNSGAGAVQYNVYRSLDRDAGFVLIGTASGPMYLDGAVQTNGQNAIVAQPLINGQTYYYEVSAVVNGIETPKSHAVNVVPKPRPSQVPNVALTLKCRSVAITWNACANADQSDIFEYRIERSTGSGGVFEVIDHYAPEWGVDTTTMQFEDIEIRTNTQYAYRVIAVSDAAESAPETPVTVNTADGNCWPEPEWYSFSAEIETSGTAYDSGTTTDDGSDSLLLAGGDDSNSSGDSTSGNGPTGGGTSAYGLAHLSWSYPAAECDNLSGFRIRYQYLSQGHLSGMASFTDVTTEMLGAPGDDNGTNLYYYDLRIKPQAPCSITISAIRDGEEGRSSPAVSVVADNSGWSDRVFPRVIPSYQQVYMDWPDSDLIYDYDVLCSAVPMGCSFWTPVAGSSYTMSVDAMAADNSAILSMDGFDTRIWDTGLNSSNLTSADLMSLSRLATRLRDADDVAGQWLWNGLSLAARQAVTNYLNIQSSLAAESDPELWQLQSEPIRQTLTDQLNALIHGGTNLFVLSQLSVDTNGDLCDRTRADLIRQAQASSGAPFTTNDVAELNRYVMEDLFPGIIARRKELEPAEYVTADLRVEHVWDLVSYLRNVSPQNDPDAMAISNAMTGVIDLTSTDFDNPGTGDPDYAAKMQTARRKLALGLTAAIRNPNLQLQYDPGSDVLSTRTLTLYTNFADLSPDEHSLLNRLMLQESGPFKDYFEPMTGLRYYVVVGNHYDGTEERNTHWVAAQPLMTGGLPAGLSLNAQAFAYSSMVLVQWYVPGMTNFVANSGTNWQFYVERKSGTDPYTPLSVVGFGLAYLDQDVVNGTTYTYRITAMDENFNRIQAIVSATPSYSSALTLLPPVPGNAYIDLSWTPVRAASFAVEHSLDQVNFETVATINNGDAYQNAASHFRHENIQNGIRHYYRIRGMTPTGIEFYSNTNSAVPLATLPPLPPDGFSATLTASPDGVGARVMLSWNPRSGADHYQSFVRQGSALVPIFDGRGIGCVYDIPLDTVNGASLCFDLRCVTVDNQMGEMEEITAVYSTNDLAQQSAETPPLRLKVAGMFAWTNDIIGPTNLTLGVETSLAIKRISFYDETPDGRHLLGQSDSEPFTFTWMQPKGGQHRVSASAEVLVGSASQVTSGTASVAVVNADPVDFNLVIKPELAAYNTSATDLQLPGMGLPITLGRSYTSHNTGTNLLGVGWLPNWTGGILKFSTALTSGWIGSTSPFLGSMTMYTVGSVTNHEVTVNLPAGGQVPFYVGVAGQSDSPPYEEMPCKLIFGAYDDVGGTLAGNGSSTVDAVAGPTQAGDWFENPLTLHDSTWDPISGDGSGDALISFSSFTYTASDGTAYLYDHYVDDLTYLLTSITDRNGNSLRYTYGDGNSGPVNQVVAITNSCGRGVTFSYESAAGYTNIWVYDAMGGTPVLKYAITNSQLMEVWRLKDRSVSDSWEKTRYVYGSGVDDTNRIVEVYDARGVRVVANAYMSATNEETAGNLLRQTNIANSVTSYSLTNNVLTVVQTVGGVSKVISVVNDDSGAIVGATTPVTGTNAPTSLTVTNTYDERGRLIAQRDALGGLKTFSYDNQDHLVGQSDANGNSTSSQVNSFGEPTAATDANGNTTSTSYDDQGNPVRVVDPVGTTTIYEYSEALTASSGRTLGRRLHRELRNAPGVPYTVVTIHAYVGEDDGEANSPAFGDEKSVTEEWGLADDANNVTVVGMPITVTNQYDANGNRTNEIKTRAVAGGGTESISSASSYDAQNRVVASLVQSSAGGILQTNGMVFNSLGKQVTSADAAGRRTISTYDYAGNLIETAYADGTVSRTSYTLDGHPEYVQDRVGTNGMTTAPATRTTYDASGRAIKVERFESVSLSLVSAVKGTDYVGADGMWKMTAVNNSATPLTTTRTFYDALGRVQFTVDARTNVTANVLDAAGRCTNTLVYLQTSQLIGSINDSTTTADVVNLTSDLQPLTSTSYAFDANGNQLVVTDSLGHSITNVYDTANRMIETDYPDTGLGKRARFTRYDGAGQKVQETDENGIVTKYSYDFRGLLRSVTLAADTAQAVITTYEYDELGNLIVQRDANNHATTFAFDALGRRISRTVPGGQTETFGYDVLGNQICLTNFNGVIITNQYDFASGRLTNVCALGYKTSYAYSQTGLRTNLIDASGTTAYRYDQFNRLTNKAVAWNNNGPTVALNYGYDTLGSLTNLWSSTVGGVTNAYQYDVLGRLTTVIASNTVAGSYGYDLVGNLQALRYGNGVTNLYQYDSRNRLTNLVWKSGSSLLASFGYTVGATGNRTASAESINYQQSSFNRTYGWTYDYLYRLTGELINGASSQSVTYGFDAVGNRTNRTSSVSGMNQAFAYTANDWLTSDTYDANGNTLVGRISPSAPTETCQYDVLNHLTNATIGTSVIQIVYDGDGNRVKKIANGVTTYYLVDEKNLSGYAQVLEEYQSINNQPATIHCIYNYGLALISQTLEPSTINQQPSTSYYGSDGHGSTRFLADTSGSITDMCAYDAYGILIASTGSTSNEYLYCGQQWDSDLGMYYNRARYYQPAYGRFWTMDSYEGNNEDPSSLHKYLYCKGNPINGIDRSGEADETLPSLTTAIGITAGLAAFTMAAQYEAKTHAIGNLMTAAWTQTMTDAGSMASAADAALSAARTSVRQLIDDAKKILKQIGQLTANVKVVPMPRSVIPAVANHVATALSTGYPAVLVRVTPATAAANRLAALAGRPSAGFGQSWDEYPFASGLPPGMTPSVAPVPWLQNCIQGGILSGCYTIEKITPGTPYLVVVTP